VNFNLNSNGMHKSATLVLFVSNENAARSILAEVCLRHLGKETFRIFSCGMPGAASGLPHPLVLKGLATAGMCCDDLRCKSFTEFTRNGAPRMDFVISLDKLTAANHPSWPGQPETALWNYPPILVSGRSDADLKNAVVQTLHSLRRRLELLVSLHMRGVKRSDLRSDLRDLAYL
jgi:arsenate reductase (thioredoxin)